MATVLANPAKMIERGAPHLIRTEEQLAAYTKALYRLTSEMHPTAAQVEAIELLTLLIERYEEEHYSVPKASPADVLRFLLDRHGLKQRDIASELGGESVVSEVLSGKRRLNAAHIEELSKRFHVSPAVFFPA
ncbi:MAG: helix-turn-helix domain-containing protein [Terracidiphilus sp.]|jgi:HTH-type transcriptional regulator/antitoxin HigA